ncbi:hypothetical protein D3C87_325030 [compost metagenome]
MAVSKFLGGYGGAVYQCRICNRNTRDTGENGGVQLCPECNEASMTENAINDYGDEMTPEELAHNEAYIVKMCQDAVNKGGVISGYKKESK